MKDPLTSKSASGYNKRSCCLKRLRNSNELMPKQLLMRTNAAVKCRVLVDRCQITLVFSATLFHTEHLFNTQISLVTTDSVPSQDPDRSRQTHVEQKILLKRRPKFEKGDARVSQLVDIDADDEATDRATSRR